MHAMIRIAGADKILQHGYDETEIDGAGTYNQWAMIEDAEGIGIVIIEAGAILVDATAEGYAQHIKTSFERGQRTVMLCLQKCIELCGEGAAKEILPIKRGGGGGAVVYFFDDERHVSYRPPSGRKV
jgi:hypothetical protein